MLTKKNTIYKTLFLASVIVILILLSKTYSNNNTEINKEKFLNKINIKNININNDKSFNKSIIYISRHDGTIANFKTIGELLKFNVTSLTPSVSINKKNNLIKFLYNTYYFKF